MNTRALARTVLLLGGVCTLAAAADPPFIFDRQLSIDLGNAYIRAAQRARPDRALPSIAYDNPNVIARIAKQGRRLVFVTYPSARPSWGATVVLELCAANSKLTVVDVNWTAGLEKYLRQISGITENDYVALPEVCSTKIQDAM